MVSSTNATFGPKVSPGASHFCVDDGRLIDVAEDCFSAEIVEEIFLGDSVEFLERSGVCCTFLIRHSELNTTDVGW